MNPIRISLALADAIHLAVVQVLSPVADQIDAQPHGEQTPSQPPVASPIPPAPFSGETSEHFASRFPAGITCTIPLGLKFDPWYGFIVTDAFNGAWIPAEAAFTAPVG